MGGSMSSSATGITMVCAMFRDTPSGRTDMRYAADLARELRVPLEIRYLAPTQGNDSSEDRRVRAATAEIIGGVPADVSFVHDGTPLPFHPGAMVIDDVLARRRSLTWTAAPQGEERFRGRGGGFICIPLGDGESGSHASLVGIPIARALGLNALFYHTTWRNPLATSSEPRDHMSPDAQLVLATAVKRAQDQKVAHEVVIEMADGVAEGIARAALRKQCALIITARGRATGRGSYVDQLLDESPIPVWSAPRTEQGS